ncbi:unnamed protein product [Calypogeia fissa]
MRLLPEKELESESGNLSRHYADGKFSAVTLGGRPIDKSRTRRVNASKFIYGLVTADYATSASVTVSLVFYLYKYLHITVSHGATIANNFTGACFLLSILGGFLADSFLGHYVVTFTGGIFQLLGLALLVATSDYKKLQPPSCTPTLTEPCPEAGAKYMAPVYVALYTIALGTGFVKASTTPFGADQFDESDPGEQKESMHYFIWYYFFENVGIVLAFSLSVYILNFISKDWGYAWLLIFYALAMLVFLAGSPKFRHKKVAGSFLTRIVQVLVSALRKRNVPLPRDDNELFDATVCGGWLSKSKKLRFLDRAAIVEKDEDIRTRWKLTGITQVEETKRILLVIPVWLCTCIPFIIFSQVTTFTATQGSTLDRSLSSHFIIPPQSLGLGLILISIFGMPIYDQIVRPILRKFTKNPYGTTPLTRIGIASVTATLAMVAAALVERKRMVYVRELGYTDAIFFELPMKMWWLLPQYFFSSMTELFLVVSIYEFFHHEVMDNTGSIGSSFSFAAIAVGYYLSSVLVNLTNSVTRRQPGGRWLVERLNDGGLENYYWLLSAIQAGNLLVFLVVAYFYEYNYAVYLSPKKVDDETDGQSD